MLADFKKFLLQGNLLELAVAFVIGAAFAAVVTALVDNLIMPILAAFGGKPNFNDLTFSINDSVFKYGAFITAVITFIFIAAAVFFFVVRPVTKIMERNKTAEDEGPSQEELLGEIKALLERQNQLLAK
ncbi:MAG: large conductance mechanosensitive channel protein MscL [Thermoleophilia bacterium]|nr:large conductance mechanosensitive channel protein MscL [Thermoleophilia bacterium]